MKLQIDVIEIDALPSDPYSHQSWPSPGVYRVKSGDEKQHLYFVEKWTVNMAYGAMNQCRPVEDQGQAVSETLLLKAIAAASRAEVLK